MPPSVMDIGQIREHERLARELSELCGGAPGSTAEGCGQADCIYFDAERERCALLVWDVPARLGLEAMRWFVGHRTPGSEPSVDEALATRYAAI